MRKRGIYLAFEFVAVVFMLIMSFQEITVEFVFLLIFAVLVLFYCLVSFLTALIFRLKRTS